MPDENITLEALDGESQLNSASASEAVTPEGNTLSESQLKGLSLDELNDTLGKQFKDKESALKALKDTFSYVGKKVDQVEEDLKTKGFISKREFEEVLFYRDNPNYGANKDIIDAYASKFGISPAEAVKSTALSGLLAKADKADSYESNQSVIESNPRLVATKSNLDKARDMSNKRGQSDNVNSLVAKAVLDAYES
jgi:hypothetical protein